MKVLKEWLRRGGRGVLLTLDHDGWTAEAVVPDGRFPPSVQISGRDADERFADPAEALESLDDELASEAGALLAAQREDA